MPSAIDWEVAKKVAVRFSGTEPFADSYHYDSLTPDFEELTARAQTLVESHTGWTSTAGEAKAQVVDRSDWVAANIASFQRMLRPLTDKMEERSVNPVATKVTAKFAGAQMGAVLGWMSTRVLGQYDLLILEDEKPDEQDIVYYVGPNILSLEKRFGFPPREFRLWVALHEVTHRTQFTGKPWVRSYFLEQTQSLLELADPSPQQFLDGLGRIAEGIRTGKSALADGGVATVFASPDQRASMERLGGLMSLLEGHGDITMDRAGGDEIPSTERFGRVLRQRRSEASGATKMLQRLMGLEAKMAQYEQGERFIEDVEDIGGPELVERAFDGPNTLPTLAEIRDPKAWANRVGTIQPALG